MKQKGFTLVELLAVIAIIAVTYFLIVIAQTGESVSLNMAKLNSYNSQVKIYDNSGDELVTTSITGNKTINLSELPDYVPKSFISIEDKQFYNHHGLNYGRIFKAGIKNLFSGYAKEGASTITQQLIKNTHLNSEKTLTRKIQEAYLALKLERNYSKEEILETYLNVIYFGNSAYGIESAAQTYFNHSAKELTLDESAILAGLIKSPKTYSPILNPEKCKERRDLVLKNMLEDDVITKSEYDEALNKEISVNITIDRNNNYNKVILEEAMRILNLSEKDVSTNGYKIYTYLNKNLQNEIAASLSEIKNIENALIIVDNLNNSVISYLGNAEIQRQVGSTIKPILCYAPAFEYGTLSPITPICDEEITFGDYSPHNANDKFLGWISTRTALAKSLNVPAVKTLEYNGIDKSKNFAKKLGLSFEKEDNHLALALGASKYGQSLQTMTNAYASFARDGLYSNLNFIKKIETSTGTTVYEANQYFNQVMREDTAFLINDILKDSIKQGTAKRLSTLNIPLSAKTGTVGTSYDNTNTDAWCISYNPKFTVGVWYGNTTGDKSKNLKSSQNGGTIATNSNKIAWNRLKNYYNINIDFEVPQTVKKLKVDALSLENKKVELASENTPEKYIITDYFSTKFMPKKESNNFTKITEPVLKLTVKSNSLVLSWEGLDYLKYKVIEKNDTNESVLSETDGENKNMTISIELPTKNTEYYIITSFKNDEENTVKSNVEKYYIPKEEKEKSSMKSIFKHWF